MISPSKPYRDSVFINCPFDEEYVPIFRAVVFTVALCGFVPRSTLEHDDASQVRIEKIYRIIGSSALGIHDVSRTELDAENQLPRFNMPLELGVFLGAKRFGPGRRRSKRCLILDRDRYRFQKFISDNPSLRSASGKSITPPSLDTSPPSKLASILRRSKLGKPNSFWVQSGIAKFLSCCGLNTLSIREPLIKWEGHLLHSKEAEGKTAAQEHPSWAVTAAPTQPPASFQCNPSGRGGGRGKWCIGGRASWKRLGRLSALLARARPLRVLPLRSRLEIRPNRFQQMPLPFNQWFLRERNA